jgi:hypothetical protein
LFKPKPFEAWLQIRYEHREPVIRDVRNKKQNKSKANREESIREALANHLTEDEMNLLNMKTVCTIVHYKTMEDLDGPEKRLLDIIDSVKLFQSILNGEIDKRYLNLREKFICIDKEQWNLAKDRLSV